MSINRLSQGDLSTSSQIPFYDSVNGQDRRGSISDLMAILSKQIAVTITQYAAPNASGFSVAVTPVSPGGSVYVLLTPAGAYAAGTVVLPTGYDGQEITIHTRQAVTALTVTPAAGDVTSGAPTTLTAGGFFKLRYDVVLKLWARVG